MMQAKKNMPFSYSDERDVTRRKCEFNVVFMHYSVLIYKFLLITHAGI